MKKRVNSLILHNFNIAIKIFLSARSINLAPRREWEVFLHNLIKNLCERPWALIDDGKALENEMKSQENNFYMC